MDPLAKSPTHVKSPQQVELERLFFEAARLQQQNAKLPLKAEMPGPQAVSDFPAKRAKPASSPRRLPTPRMTSKH